MKKIFFGMMAMVALVATSCQQDANLGVQTGETTSVAFNLATPQIATKAKFSEGALATHLQYAVYDANQNILDTFTVTDGVINGSTQVEFQLTTGNTYYVLFWAAAPGAPYTVDLAAKTMEVSYAGATCSDENRDAFYYYDDFTVKAGMDPISAELRRPFAQLNIGTDDLAESEAAGYKVTQAKVTVPVYTNLDFASGEATNKQVVTFEYEAVPTSYEFPVAGYEYLAMNYLLMNTTKEPVDVKFQYTDGTTAQAERTVGSVPVQRNHRTNLYGQLLTTNSKVNVEINPEYEDDMHNGVIEVATAEQFNAAFANPEVDFIVLAKDVTLTTSVARTNPTLTVSAGEELTLNLNGHRLIAESTQLFDVDGTLIIENGTIENTNGQVFDNNDDVKFSNATILQTTDSAYFDEDGDKLELIAEGVVKVSDDNYAITAACGLYWFANNVAACNGKTIELYSDITVADDFYPIGYNNGDRKYFEGTFDGNNKTIKNLKRFETNGSRRAIGLFSQVKNATVKNLTLEDFVAAATKWEAAAIACEAVGDCVFENITLKKGSVVTYNNDTAGIVGWANKGNFTFKDITIGSDVTIHSIWGSPDGALGGVVGTLESPSTVSLENVTISCKLDAYNDCCANYKYYAYRRCGMLIGNMSETQVVNGTTYPNPAAAGVTCVNVTVTYGDWMNYHYCEFQSNGHGSYDDEFTWTHSRVEGSEWGRESNIDTDNCQHQSFESHNVCYPIDQLFGGGQGVYGLPAYEGVTVNYPAEYTCPLCGQQHNVK